jgi:predicted small secreted protein
MGKALILAALLTCSVFMAGCHTVKRTAQGAAAGVSEDYEEAKKVDKYLQDKLW